MAQQNDELLKRLLGIFKIEAEEHLKMMSSGLLELENKPDAERYADIVEKIFREAHSLKGAARAVDLKDVESICQALESVFSEMKRGRLDLSRPLYDLLYETLDVLTEITGSDHGVSVPPRPIGTLLVRRLEEALKGQFSPRTQQRTSPNGSVAADTGLAESFQAPPSPTAQITPAVLSACSETIRVSAAKFDKVMRQVEELLSPRLAMVQRGRELRDITVDFASWKKQRLQVRPVLRALDRSVGKFGTGGTKVLRELPMLLELMDTEFEAMKTLEDKLQRLNRAHEHDKRQLQAMIDNLMDDVKEMYLLPFSSIVEIYPRFVRELARAQSKQVELVIKGSEIEIDRRILEEMKDPLMHLLRNAVDHGIETPDVRLDRHKQPQGKIAITIAQIDSGKVEILIADDGAGIDTTRVKAAACKLGVISAGEIEKASDNDIQAWVFRSGISTSPLITDVSGRGLGLAIVQEKVEKLGGISTLESNPGTGTRFRIVLPLAMASFRGLLVSACDRFFVIPAMSVERVMRVAEAEIATVENRETILMDDQVVSLVRLGDILELPRPASAGKAIKVPVVILGLGAVRIAFRLDAILGEQEVAVRPLGRQLARVRNVVGATVLGSGQVVPVLNAADLIKSAMKRDLPAAVVMVEAKPLTNRKKNILVVEDSITSRVLLKNILESVGYNVVTAVDGVDAYRSLMTGDFDLVVSDVEMPRMDGFILTTKIRSDKKLAELPIVLVTALETSEHRERGIDVGANAYIVKSNFDQSNLLEVIGRLI